MEDLGVHWMVIQPMSPTTHALKIKHNRRSFLPTCFGTPGVPSSGNPYVNISSTFQLVQCMKTGLIFTLILHETVVESVDWIALAQDKDGWRAVVKEVMKLRTS